MRKVGSGQPEEVDTIVSGTKSLKADSFKISEDEITGENVLRGAGDIDLSITNKLETRDILVTKDWNDNYYGKTPANDQDNVTVSDLSKNLHYQTAIRLECSQGSYSETRYLSNAYSDNGYGVLFRDVPIYDKNGEVIYYKVTEYKDNEDQKASAGSDIAKLGTGVWSENAADPYYTDPIEDISTKTAQFSQLTGETEENSGKYHNSYGYEGGAKKYTKTVTLKEAEGETPAETATYPTRYNITDTLPLTAVDVEKTWDDQSDIFGIRPADIKSNLTLSHAAVDTGTLAMLTDDGAANLTFTNLSSENYDYVETASAFPAKSGNKYTYTYTKLLKYDENNKPYIFKIAETQVTAYKAPEYTKQYLTSVLPNDFTTDGTVSSKLTSKLAVKNELDTRDITVVKKWDDGGNTYTHYDLDITLSSTGLTCSKSGKNDGTTEDKDYNDILQRCCF